MDSEVHEKELEQLVSLAEDVSEKIERAERSHQYTTTITIVSLALLMTSFIYSLNELNLKLSEKRDNTILLIVLTIVSVFLFYVFLRKQHYKRLDSEKVVLRNLLNLISTHKELAYGEMTVVSKAVFDMRLNRIKFATESSDISE